MPTLYLTEQYSTVKKNGDCIVVQPPTWTRGKEKAVGTGVDASLLETPVKTKAAVKVEVPLVKIDHVVVMGNITMTAPALYTLLENGISICYLSAHGRYMGQLDPEFSKNAPLRIAQHQAHNDPTRRVALARACVSGKLRNMRAVLLRAARTRSEQDAALGAAAAILKESQRRAEQVTTVPELLGHEGTGAAAYFGVFGSLLREGWVFTGRVRRPPTDPVNALLSFGYALLTSQISAAVQLVGLDPFVGYLHVVRYGRPALALDLIEEFRAPIVDSVVLTVINNRILSPNDFTSELGAVTLMESGRRTYVQRFEERLTSEIVHPIFGYKATYRRCLELQVRLLAEDYHLTNRATAQALGRTDHSTALHSRARVATALSQAQGQDTLLARVLDRARADLAGHPHTDDDEERERRVEGRRRALAAASSCDLAEYRYWRLRSLRAGNAW